MTFNPQMVAILFPQSLYNSNDSFLAIMSKIISRPNIRNRSSFRVLPFSSSPLFPTSAFKYFTSLTRNQPVVCDRFPATSLHMILIMLFDPLPRINTRPSGVVNYNSFQRPLKRRQSLPRVQSPPLIPRNVFHTYSPHCP